MYYDHGPNINMNIDIDNLYHGSQSTHKLKLDDIIESIKSLRTTYNIPEEIRIAIKILKKFKLSETSKWY
jgi:hypothetical protein